jgi:hypothetical protein
MKLLFGIYAHATIERTTSMKNKTEKPPTGSLSLGG